MKKGFTLIELLAVILILGIIALIAVPQVTNTIEKSKKGSAETSAKHYIDAVTNAIGLNQLDEDSSNDIEDGTYDVSELTVDISGAEPDSGTVVVDEGTVKSANFIINGYNVVCTGKGKCSASKGNSNYVYYQTVTDSPVEITLADTTPTPDPSKNAYLKIDKNDISKKQACFNDNGTEFCLNPGEYDVSKQKILDYFGYDSNTWTQDPNNENVWLKTPGDDTIGCDIRGSGVYCGDSVVGAYALSNGYVGALDMSTRFYCGVDPDGSAGCGG